MIINDTICAISTPAGTGGIAVLRVSGKEAFEVCQKCFRPKRKGTILAEQKPYTLHFGAVVDESGEEIDHVLLSVFKAPHSFTGEDTVEISCHGSVFIQSKILQTLIGCGCRMAQAGEFSMRAFANGKMDLSQAEAVSDLISSTSAAMHRMAMSQMKGSFSRELSALREKLLEFTSLIELELDFSEEDVEFADRQQLIRLAEEVEAKISMLAKSFSTGDAIKNGVPVAIVGKTNVGKSTLLNRLLGDERAIVSNIAGTTRDSIEDTTVIEGITFRFIDTAGIRQTADEIENIGIARTYDKMRQSQVVVWLVDSTETDDEKSLLLSQLSELDPMPKLLVAINKIDRLGAEKLSELSQELAEKEIPHIAISAKNDQNLDQLRRKLIEISGIEQESQGDVIVSNVRHYEALRRALTSIRCVLEGLQSGISHDFVAQDLRETLYHLGEITGEITTDDVLGSIFSKFCIGK